MTKINITYTLILAILFHCSLFSQAKNEVEIRVTAAQFPDIALTYLKGLPENTKPIKLFKETNNEKSSFEAKFKLRKKHYSIEFNKEGILEDIEIYIKKRHINKQTFHKIDSYLTKNYSKYRFIKIQKQYRNTTNTNTFSVLNEAIKNTDVSNIFYETITEITIEGKREILEITFTKDGVFSTSQPVNLESYEHVLY
ncbi:hypothetical protein Q4512_01280 [Oceanihabitans sp. 2_MG-2023]|uniref:hypothetical protein n=1 Tax=Oceanihabitans sp. 2_MG-2023 TaxID=3062661 RepID=UPI0026E44C53|nr:hypothetical protein [Oceanihabitans sp. 2_MG-2023]MDO6595523.1 hypothetical protein [Oceanihabitans sp. 2_MG-2023]